MENILCNYLMLPIFLYLIKVIANAPPLPIALPLTNFSILSIDTASTRELLCQILFFSSITLVKSSQHFDYVDRG